MTALVLVALSASPASAASTQILASEIQVFSGHDVTGSPALLVRDQDVADSPGFLLRAESLRAETDHRPLQVLAAGAEAQHKTEQHQDARVHGTTWTGEARMFVVPGPGSTATLDSPEGCSGIEAASTPRGIHDPRVGGRDPIRVSLEDTVEWTPCGKATVTLQGDLFLVLWAWNARIVSDLGASDLESGHGDLATGTREAQEQFLFARNATLVLPAGRQGVYLDEAKVAVWNVLLWDAVGAMDGADVNGPLSLVGEVVLSVQGRGVGAPVAVAVEGQIEGAWVGDRPLASSRSWYSWWPGLLLGAALVGVVHARPHLTYFHAERTGGDLGSLVPQNLRQRRAVGLWIMARRSERRRWFRTTLRRATRANDLFRPFPEAQFTRAVAAAKLGRSADAMTDFVDLYHRNEEPVGRAAAACGLAQECCRIGKWDGGREWLLLAAQESMSYTQRATHTPGFEAFAGEAWFDTLQQGEDVSGRDAMRMPGPSHLDPSVQ